MPTISYIASNFGRRYGSTLQGYNTLTISWSDIIWASISVGKLDLADVFGHHIFSFREHQMKYYLVYANLMQNSKAICRTTLYDSLDSTEKGSISYFVGMMCAKLVGTFLLGTPWLVHLEKLKKYYNIGVLGRHRPDLVGQDKQGNWVVVEAKGRTNAFSQNALNKAKQQTRSLRNISGQVPSLRVATESYFNSYSPPNLSMVICDPEEHDEQAEDATIDTAQLTSVYYRPFSVLPTIATREIETLNRKFWIYDDEEFGVSIGIDNEVLEIISAHKLTQNDLAQITQGVETFIQFEEENLRLYPDGLVVGCNERWSEETMNLEPQERFKT